MFENLTNSFTNTIKKLRYKDDEKALKKAIDELKKSLLKSDVHYKVVKNLLKDVEVKTKLKGIGKDSFLDSLKTSLNDILLTKGNQGFVFAQKPPTKILISGLQGSGKTTTVSKLAYYLKLRNKKVLLVAADLQRAGAVEQLKQMAKLIDVDIYFDDNEKNSLNIVKKLEEKLKESLYDVVLLDTAGRLSIDLELMEELKQIKKAFKPDEVFYVADSLTGQDAVLTANNFKENVGIDGVILTKFDGDSKGGVAIGIASLVNVPLRFIANGEKHTDLEVFIPDRIVNRLMGAGDVESLAEKTSLIMDDKKAKDLGSKIKKGKFNFDDFLEQMESISKIGSMKSLVSMIPGMGHMGDAIKNLDLDNSSEIKQIKAMISSMTKKERQDPDLLNNSRKKRIAFGSGLEVSDVNSLIKKFKNISKMAKKFSGKRGIQDLQNLFKQNNSALKLQ